MPWNGEDYMHYGVLGWDETGINSSWSIQMPRGDGNFAKLVGGTNTNGASKILNIARGTSREEVLASSIGTHMSAYVWAPSCNKPISYKIMVGLWCTQVIHASDVYSHLSHCLFALASTGKLTTGMVGDAHSVNKKVLLELFEVHDKCLRRCMDYNPQVLQFAVFDFPHILKAIRNKLLSNLVMMCVKVNDELHVIKIKLNEFFDEIRAYSKKMNSLSSKQTKCLEALQLACPNQSYKNGYKMHVDKAAKIFSNTLQKLLQLVADAMTEYADALEATALPEEYNAKKKKADDFQNMVTAFQPLQKALNEGLDSFNNVIPNAYRKGGIKVKGPYYDVDNVDNVQDKNRMNNIERMATTFEEMFNELKNHINSDPQATVDVIADIANLHNTSSQSAQETAATTIAGTSESNTVSPFGEERESKQENTSSFDRAKNWWAQSTMDNLHFTTYGILAHMSFVNKVTPQTCRMFANILSTDIIENIFRSIKGRAQGASITAWDFIHIQQTRERYSYDKKVRMELKRMSGSFKDGEDLEEVVDRRSNHGTGAGVESQFGNSI